MKRSLFIFIYFTVLYLTAGSATAQPDLQDIPEATQKTFQSETKLDVQIHGGEFAEWSKEWKDTSPHTLTFRWYTDYETVGSAEWQITLDPEKWELLKKGNAGQVPGKGKESQFTIDFASPGIAGGVWKRPVTYYVRVVTYKAKRKVLKRTEESGETPHRTESKKPIGIPSAPVRVVLIPKTPASKIVLESDLYIQRSEPEAIIEGPQHSKKIEMWGKGFLSESDVPIKFYKDNQENLNNYQKVWYRLGNKGKWELAKYDLYTQTGTGFDYLPFRFQPGFIAKPPLIQIKVQVLDKVSEIHEIPVHPQPSIKPHIDKVHPGYVKISRSDSPFKDRLIVYASGINQYTRPRFHGQEIESYSNFYFKLKEEDRYISFNIPKSFRNKPGRYSVQLVNNIGYSNLVFMDIVKETKIESIMPATFSPLYVKPGESKFNLTIYYTGYPPKSVSWRLDGSGDWKKFSESLIKNISTDYVDIEIYYNWLNEAKDKIEFKLTNKSGESNTVTMKVIKPGINFDKPGEQLPIPN